MRLHRRTFLACLLLALPACQLAPHRPPALDLDPLFALAREVRNPVPSGLAWLDAGHYLVHGTPPGAAEGAEPMLHRVAVDDGRWQPLYDAGAMTAALEALPAFDRKAAERWSRRSRYTWLPDHAGVLIRHGGGLHVYRFAEDRAVTILADTQGVVGETLSPDGKRLAFVRDNDLWTVSTLGGEEPVRLTTDGSDTLLNGRLDWVYQEEIYGRGQWNAFWWSPDSRRLCFLQLDDGPVPVFRVEDHLRDDRYGHLEEWRYPKAGEPNPLVRVGLVAATGGPVVWADLERWPAADRLVMHVSWTPDAREAVLQVANRIQTRIDVAFADAESGATRVAFAEQTMSWAEPSELYWLDDQEFLWLSARDGWRHLYRYRRDGTLRGRVTAGEWEIESLLAVDPVAGQVYAVTDEAAPTERHLWRIALQGGGRERLTGIRGTHRVQLSPDRRHYLDSWSNAGDPGATELRTVASGGGELVRTLSRGDLSPAAEVFVAPEFYQVPDRDGFLMEARLYRPPDFRPGRRYPVFVTVYTGPNLPVVWNAFGGFSALWYSALARRGILVWSVDNESASGKGHVHTSVAYRRLGQTELEDLEDSLDWLVAQGWADPERVAIHGWSYGGYITTYALTHSERFRVGIAGAPVTDWRNYDSIYTERFMDTPEANPEGYEASSAVAAAEHLHGRLLLLHGTIDENVHLANTLEFAWALQKAGQPFAMMLYPRNRHGIGDADQRRHLYRTMTCFLLENL